MDKAPGELPYTPFYCEENVWRLCQLPRFAVDDCHALWISSAGPAVPLYSQRAAHAPGEPVWWDYHVVLWDERGPTRVWDRDCTAGCPLPAGTWLARTFPYRSDSLPPAFRPAFRLIPAPRFARAFRSDRSHMRTPQGAWQAPPPAWSAPSADGSDIASLSDPADPRWGPALDLAALRGRLGPGRAA